MKDARSKLLSAATCAAALLSGTGLTSTTAQAQADAALKQEAMANVDAHATMVQQAVDQIFSYAEPGFQEVKSTKYIAGLLEKNGFKIEWGIAGIPTAFKATWGEGGPLIALGSDIDCLLGVSQYPGTGKLIPMVAGAPGHGEGHNSGMPLIVAAAIAAKDVMTKHGIKGRLMIWPGIAEELLATKAYYVRDGLFKGVDANIFTHVSSDFGTAWGELGNNGLVSVEYTFHGRTAHAAGDPWDGLSALDAVELMDTAWNFRREHLPVTQRSHYVITNGGGQPNVVPDLATVWYYFRERTFKSVADLYKIGNDIADGAAKQTGTTVEHRILGYAAPNYGNKPMAEAAYENIKLVGMPKWTADDQTFAKTVQTTLGREVKPLPATVGELSTPANRQRSIGGGSDDVGDIMWTVPSITIRFPSNIPSMIAHNKIAAIAMATPIAHKGAVAGAKAVALTVLDLMTTPDLIAKAKDFQQNVQFKEDSYAPLITASDKPAIWLNHDLMEKMRPQMAKFYYDSAKYPSYLAQLGIAYPGDADKDVTAN